MAEKTVSSESLLFASFSASFDRELRKGKLILSMCGHVVVAVLMYNFMQYILTHQCTGWYSTCMGCVRMYMIVQYMCGIVYVRMYMIVQCVRYTILYSSVSPVGGHNCR